jgi:hypothetical protein
VGDSISIEFLPNLSVHRRQLLSDCGVGHEVHAGSFLRDRSIVIDSTLRGSELTRILLHELFHFAWIRLSNAKRASYSELIAYEQAGRARGELGWSAEWRKTDPRIKLREYLCESFCDTGAWRYGVFTKHDEFTLAHRWQEKRRAWFDEAFPERVIKI